MHMRRVLLPAVLALATSLPALAADYKYSYAADCGALWGAVKTALGDQDHYADVRFDEASHTASYQIRYKSPVKVNGQAADVQVQGIQTGPPRQVVLAPEGKGCSAQLHSNRVGLDRDGHDALKKAIDAALAPKPAAEAAK